MIRSKQRVVLTTDDIDLSKQRAEGFFRRTSYIGVFDIRDFVLDNSGMSFNSRGDYSRYIQKLSLAQIVAAAKRRVSF